MKFRCSKCRKKYSKIEGMIRQRGKWVCADCQPKNKEKLTEFISGVCS